MEALRGWVINICTTVFFITAVEMILPDNNLKKYSKFVLGLILMTVIINPLVKFLNGGADITAFINKTTASLQQQNVDNSQQYREKNINDTLNVFETNVEKLCISKLKEEYPKNNAEVKVKVEYNPETQEYIIDRIDVGISDGTVQSVKKVEVRTSNSTAADSKDESKYSMEVKEYLGNILELPKSKIVVYNLSK